jgi:hypothetical protein
MTKAKKENKDTIFNSTSLKKGGKTITNSKGENTIQDSKGENTITIFNGKNKKEKKMKKLIFTMFLVLVAAFLFTGVADAGVSGACGTCHTMHNSQDGSAVDASGPNDLLLRADCTGCHTGSGVAGAPLIDKTSNIVSAGSFADSQIASETGTHNVADLPIGTFTEAGAADTQHGNDAPGGVTLGTQLKCAGTSGCHGDHDSKTTSFAGISGYHHGSSAYKYLGIATGNSGATTDVAGEKSADWEAGGADATNHNVYRAGATGISNFCNNCHADFHDNDANNLTAGDSSLWNRHPTDEALTTLPTTTGISVDYVNTPFAFDTGVTVSSTAATGYTVANGQVMCLSCHRAHATGQADLLRFDYSAQNAGGSGTTGCLNCHVNQR